MSNTQTLAFFGATGGCTAACLAHTIRNGYTVNVLARSPEKLKGQLLEQPGLTPEILETNLKIIQGDATDVETVTKTLIISEEPNKPPTLVHGLISGMGGAGTVVLTRPSGCDKVNMRVPSLPHVEIPNPHITEQFTTALLAALRGIAERFDSFAAYKAVAPRVTIISSTGIRKGLKDVPFWFRAMYQGVLAIPHADKRKMNELLVSEREKEESLFVGGLIIVRPSLLYGDHIIKDGVDDGFGKLRVGTEKKPAVGYMVPKNLIGKWIYEEVVKGGGDRWVGEGVTLTE